MQYSKTILIEFNIIMLVIAMLSTFFDSKTRIKILFLQALIVSIFFGFRDRHIGADTHVYVNEYLIQSSWLDIGFTFINKFIFLFFKSNWRIYLFIISFMISINTSLIYKTIFEKNNRYVCISYWALFSMPYMIMMQVNIIRQGLAITLFIVGYIYLYIYNKKIGILFLFFSCIVHYTITVVLIGLFIFVRLKIRPIFIIIFSIILVLISLSDFIEIMVNLVPSDYLRLKFFAYLNHNKANIGFFIKYIFYFLGYIYMSIFIGKINNDIYKFLHSLFGLLLIISSFLYTNELSATRFLLSADIIIPLAYLYPYICFKDKNIYLVIYILLNSIYYIFSVNSTAFMYNFYM